MPSMLAQWAAPMAVLLATSITVYKFYVQRPSLLIDADVVDETVTAAEATAQLQLYVANVGRDFAEDGYVEFEVGDWAADVESESDAQSTTALSVDGQPAVEQDDSERYVHKLFVDDIIYQGTGFKLYRITATFEPGDTCTIDYTTACRSHRPRHGTLEIRAENGTVTARSGCG